MMVEAGVSFVTFLFLLIFPGLPLLFAAETIGCEMSNTHTPVWEDVPAWGPSDSRARLVADVDLRHQREAMADSPPGFPSCITYDVEMAETTVVINERFALGDVGPVAVMRDTDAYIRQGDGGPYHWEQGPQTLRVVTPTPVPPPVITPAPKRPPEAKPGSLPRKGRAIVTADLNLRKKPGGDIMAVMSPGESVRLTGGRRMHEGSLWVRVMYRPLGPDRVYGWCRATWLAVPATEYKPSPDFPPVTHQYLWWLDDPGSLDHEAVRAALTAIADDPRGPFRAGLDLREAEDPTQADCLVRIVRSACGGAAGCYYRAEQSRARVDLSEEYFGTHWLSRVWLHEVVGHAATSCYDHYNAAPQFPRPDYSGFMGNWTDAAGDHAWPDQDDIENLMAWLAGTSPFVFVRDIPPPG